MFQLRARVRIPRDSFEDTLAAIKALHGRETCGTPGDMHFMWIDDSAAFLAAGTLDDALDAWRWPISETDQNGNVEELDFRGEHYGDEDLLFAAIAQSVMPGSEIVMAGEDGTVWRWYFIDRKVRKEYGRVVYDHPAE